MTLEIRPITGMPDLRPGDDLAAAIAAAAPDLADGDVLVVTSKVVSKVEGRLLPVPDSDPEERERIRQAAIAAETVRVVARRGGLQIVETRQGLVLAAAGVDASNVRQDEIALLPLDPDASARRLRDALRELTGRTVAVILSDSMGRPWRHGIADVAIGVAGLAAVLDVRGQTDSHGNRLLVTEVAVADELAAAADLVKGKLAGIPIAIVRGYRYSDDGKGSSQLIRGSVGDLFRLGTAEAMALGQASAADVSEETTALHADVLATLGSMPLDPADGSGQAAVREGFYGLLAARPDATRRSCVPGHITASVVLFDATGDRVLLTLHPRVGAWLQLGGHLEDDRSLLAAALREGVEESGIPGIVLDPVPIDLDVHPITCSFGVPTRHFDVRFTGSAPAGAEPVCSAESDDLRWFEVDRLPADIAPELPGLIARARAARAAR